MLKQVIVCAVACAVLGACAHPPGRPMAAQRPYYPVIDPKTSVNQGQNYSVDVAQCQAASAQAAQEHAAGDVVGGALVGAALGAAVGAVAGGPGHAGTGAAIGAAVGGVGGAAHGAAAAQHHAGGNPQVISNCMRARGYNVLY